MWVWRIIVPLRQTQQNLDVHVLGSLYVLEPSLKAIDFDPQLSQLTVSVLLFYFG